MNSVEIQISSIGNYTNIYIDIKNNKTTINNQEKSITSEKIDELVRIIRTWDSIYQNQNNLIDSESFLVKIITNEGIEEIKGSGDYPNNYLSLKEWISDLNE